MMKRNGWMGLALLPTLLLAACSGSPEDGKTVKVQVAPQQVACAGITQQRCLEVRFADDAPWQLFYGNIKGFDFQPGFQYLLEVRQQDVKQDDPTRSRLAWELVKEWQKTPVAAAPAAAALPTVTAQPAP